MSMRNCGRSRRRRSRRCSSAAAAPSLAEYLRNMGWMHPFYGELREALPTIAIANDHERELLALNLERARALPAGKQRYVLVNAAQQRLFMYDDGKPMDSMVVVVGKPKYPTPMLTAYVRYRRAQSLLVRAARPRRGASRPIRHEARPQISRRLWAMSCVSDWSRTRHPRSQDRLESGADGKVEVLHPAEAGAAEFHGPDEVHVPQ